MRAIASIMLIAALSGCIPLDPMGVAKVNKFCSGKGGVYKIPLDLDGLDCICNNGDTIKVSELRYIILDFPLNNNK